MDEGRTISDIKRDINNETSVYDFYGNFIGLYKQMMTQIRRIGVGGYAVPVGIELAGDKLIVHLHACTDKLPDRFNFKTKNTGLISAVVDGVTFYSMADGQEIEVGMAKQEGL